MRSHGRVRNAGPNDSVYRPIALAVLEGSMDQCRTATARDRLPRARMTPSATRRAAAPHPATNRYSGPKARRDVSPTKKSPGTLLSNQWLRLGIALSVLISVRSDGSIIVNFVISTL